jgi:hypothetical protein
MSRNVEGGVGCYDLPFFCNYNEERRKGNLPRGSSSERRWKELRNAPQALQSSIHVAPSGIPAMPVSINLIKRIFSLSWQIESHPLPGPIFFYFFFFFEKKKKKKKKKKSFERFWHEIVENKIVIIFFKKQALTIAPTTDIESAIDTALIRLKLWEITPSFLLLLPLGSKLSPVLITVNKITTPTTELILLPEFGKACLRLSTRWWGEPCG